jgi:exportin-1
MDFYSVLQGSHMSQHIYPKIFEHVEQILVDRMAKPKEVLIIINEDGEAVEEEIEDSETIQIYETMRETLVYLTNIDKIGVERVI